MNKSEYVSRMEERSEKIEVLEKAEVEASWEAIKEIQKEVQNKLGFQIEIPNREKIAENPELFTKFRNELVQAIRQEGMPDKAHEFRERLMKLKSEKKPEIDRETLVKVNTENHIDYYEYVGDEIELSQDSLAMYIFAEEDVIPAVHLPPKRWIYVGLNDQGSKEFDDTKIEFISQDINEGLPQVDDDAVDLVLIKSPGPAEETTLENSFRIARKKLSSEGLILSDQEVNMKGLEVLGSIGPKPMVADVRGKPLKDPYTGYTPFPVSEPLIVYKKRRIR